MRVYINRMPVSGPWGGGNIFTSAFHKRAPQFCDLDINPTGNITPDVILMVGLDNDGWGISIDQAVMYKLYVKPDVKIVLRVNENDARKGTNTVDPLLLKVSEHIDATVFVSTWLQQYFNDKGWACKEQAVIVNGVAADVFKPQPKLNNGKLNIVTHHWSNNEMKGFDIYEKLDELVGQEPDRYAFTYIGRERGTFKHTKVVKPLVGVPLGEELGKHDLYVSASRFDPGPNHVLEALSCGLPTYVHEDGGGCVEFAGVPNAYANWENLKSFLEAIRKQVDEFPPNGAYDPHRLFPDNSIKLRTWNDCIKAYVDYLEQVQKS